MANCRTEFIMKNASNVQCHTSSAPQRNARRQSEKRTLDFRNALMHWCVDADSDAAAAAAAPDSDFDSDAALPARGAAYIVGVAYGGWHNGKWLSWIAKQIRRTSHVSSLSRLFLVCLGLGRIYVCRRHLHALGVLVCVCECLKRQPFRKKKNILKSNREKGGVAPFSLTSITIWSWAFVIFHWLFDCARDMASTSTSFHIIRWCWLSQFRVQDFVCSYFTLATKLAFQMVYSMSLPP